MANKVKRSLPDLGFLCVVIVLVHFVVTQLHDHVRGEQPACVERTAMSGQSVLYCEGK